MQKNIRSDYQNPGRFIMISKEDKMGMFREGILKFEAEGRAINHEITEIQARLGDCTEGRDYLVSEK